MREFRDLRAKVLVVWEPMVLTDFTAPGTRTLARISDPRAAQFWDKKHLLSDRMQQAARVNPAAVLGESRLENPIIWDFVAVYPPGVRWGDVFPAAKFAGAPVIHVISEVRRNLM